MSIKGIHKGFNPKNNYRFQRSTPFLLVGQCTGRMLHLWQEADGTIERRSPQVKFGVPLI